MYIELHISALGARRSLRKVKLIAGTGAQT